MSSIDKPVLYEYNDFRLFLSDFYDYKNKQEPKFNKTFICKQLGLPKSRSYFQEVLRGRIISQPKIALFIDLLELTDDEAKYFRALVNYNQVGNDQEEKELLLHQLIRLHKSSKKIITENEYIYYSKWYHSVIRALLDTINFKSDYKFLSKKIFPSITVKEARSSIKLLLDLNLIKKNDEGYYKPTDTVISTGTLIKNELIKQYQLNCLDVAKNTITANSSQSQQVITRIMSVSEECQKEIEQSVARFNSEITALVRNDKKQSDRVYQFDMLFYPQSRFD